MVESPRRMPGALERIRRESISPESVDGVMISVLLAV